VTVDVRWVEWTIGAALIVLLIAAVWVWSKGRPFAPGDVFRASRWSRGNRLFPTQVLITPSSVVQYTPHWIGRHEETIHMAHVSSVRIDTGMLFSNLFIETSGGSDPIRCYGHGKGDATRMKDLIEKYQTEYYRAAVAPTTPGLEPPAAGGKIV
jgi:predicted small integral membrane protein